MNYLCPPKIVVRSTQLWKLMDYNIAPKIKLENFVESSIIQSH